MTEFWKITHMGAREIIRIFMFSGVTIKRKVFSGVTIKRKVQCKKYFKNFLVI